MHFSRRSNQKNVDMVNFIIVALLLLFSFNTCEAFFTKFSIINKKYFAPFKFVTTSEMTTKKAVIGKVELLEILKEKTKLPKKSLESVLSAFTDTMREKVLHEGNDIRIKEFGTFKQKVTSARKGRNPRTGEELQINGTTSITFSVSRLRMERMRNNVVTTEVFEVPSASRLMNYCSFFYILVLRGLSLSYKC
mmetsp:Transcript_7911/g.10959  ORF Transcript_7911/g.10959 Transcript_7911/m.10959 type:complete len:193 (-) Transcript_7911:68-646(-)